MMVTGVEDEKLRMQRLRIFLFFNDTATTEIYTLSLHDALPISVGGDPAGRRAPGGKRPGGAGAGPGPGRAVPAREIGRAHV